MNLRKPVSTMPQETETTTESKKTFTAWQKRITMAGKIGRIVCIMLIFLVCGNVIRNIFRLLDSFHEKEPTDLVSNLESDLPPLFPAISFDPEGQWELAGLSPEMAQPLLPMPETVTMVGSRNDRNGTPLMQLFEYRTENSSDLSAKPTQFLLGYWLQKGWKYRIMENPPLVAYWCENGEYRCFVQFFSDNGKFHILICLAPEES